MLGLPSKADKERESALETTGENGEAQAPDERTLTIIDHALRIQAPLANRYVASLRKKRPELSDDELVAHIEKQFTRMLTASGAGVGGVAALPGVGTIAAIALTTGEGAAFAEACAFLTLAVARIRDVDMSDKERRRTITLAILGGEKGQELVSKALGKQGVQWTTVLNGVAPDFVMSAVNKQMKRWIRRKVASRLGSVWAGRLIPFGVGALIGGVGNRAIAKSVLSAQRTVFAHAPGLQGSAPAAGGIEA